MPPGLLIVNASEVVTLAGGVRGGAAQDDVAPLLADGAGGPEGSDGPAVAAWEGRIVAAGRRPDVERELAGLGIDEREVLTLDAAGGTVTPGLVDPHSHLLFAGTRQAEFLLRLRGHSYLEILAAGGGILQTVRETRVAPDEDLLAGARRWLGEMLRHGTTAVEVKSGYGLSVDHELRLLELAGRLGREGPVEIVPTYLGAHAVAPEFRDRPDATAAYVSDVIEAQLPAVAEQGIAASCDVFCEESVFDAGASARILEAAQRLGLAVRLHADEIRPSGGAELAARLGALSADHLAAISPAGMDALAARASLAAPGSGPVIATLLPATTFFLLSDRHAPARELIARGVPVALGSDFNPGTSPTPNMQLVMALACQLLRMTPSEALAAATINAAAALGLQASHGSLEPGKHANLVVWDVASHDLLPYWMGADLVRTVVTRGRVAYARA